MQWLTSDVKDRLRAREQLVGTFMKTPSHIAFEVMGLSGLDFVVMDKEHAPFSPANMDPCLLAARAGGMPVITRLPSAAPEEIQSCLDMGACGILVPHVCSAGDAADIVRASTYGVPGGRGYAGSTRAARYTRKPMAQHMHDCARQNAVIAAIEDPEAVECVDAIAAVEGLDAMFIGPMDLTVSYGESSPQAPAVMQAISRVCAAGKKAGIGVGIFSSVAQVPAYRELGVTFFLVGSDHAFMLAEAERVVAACKSPPLA